VNIGETISVGLNLILDLREVILFFLMNTMLGVRKIGVINLTIYGFYSLEVLIAKITVIKLHKICNIVAIVVIHFVLIVLIQMDIVMISSV
jgi:hypothetical protein